MLSQTKTIEAVAKGLDRHHAENIVVDPVMVATSGDRLLASDAIEAVRTLLIPRALVVTPNLPEAAALLGHAAAHSESEMEKQARGVLALGAQSVLIKGGHGSGPDSIDLLVDATGVSRFAAVRIATQNTHGSGCTLSSAIAAGLARGLDLKAAVRDAKAYVTAAIASADALKIGRGHGPLHHFHELWRTP
jgi:hydroxymethylpyrimidine/phosphomethylpyrimidine kinase